MTKTQNQDNGTMLGSLTGVGYTCNTPRLGHKPTEDDKSFGYVDLLIQHYHNGIRDEKLDPIQVCLRLSYNQAKLLGVGSKVAFEGRFIPDAYVGDDGVARASFKQVGRLINFKLVDVKEPKGKKAKKSKKAKKEEEF